MIVPSCNHLPLPDPRTHSGASCSRPPSPSPSLQVGGIPGSRRVYCGIESTQRSQIRFQLCHFIHSFFSPLFKEQLLCIRSCVEYTVCPSPVSSSVKKRGGWVMNLLGGLEIIYVKHPVRCLVYSNALRMIARTVANYAFPAIMPWPHPSSTGPSLCFSCH